MELPEFMVPDFQLSVSALGDGQYQLSLKLAIAPELPPVEETVNWQPEEWIASWRNYSLEEWGEKLTAALLVGEIHQQWQDALSIAEPEGDEITISLSLPDGVLWLLPWEAMFIGNRFPPVQLTRQLERVQSQVPEMDDDDMSWLRDEPDPSGDAAVIQDIFANLPQSGDEPATASDPPPPKFPISGKTKSMLALGIIGAITIGGLAIARQVQQYPIKQLTAISLTPADVAPLDNSLIVSVAKRSIKQRQWDNLAIALESLLERRAWMELSQLLNMEALPADHSQLAFLLGRYAWQRGYDPAAPDGLSQAEAITQAEEHWETALQLAPENVDTLKALGFVHYVNAEYEFANDRWYAALASASIPEQDVSPTFQSQIYAGLAISIYQLTKNQSGSGDESMLAKAKKLRAIAFDLSDQPLTVETLEDSWLWPETAIAAWEELLKIE